MSFAQKIWSVLAAAALCAVVALGTGSPVAAEWPPGVVVDDEFTLNVQVLQEAQVIQIGLLAGPPMGTAYVHFELAADDPTTGALVTSDSTLVVPMNGQGIGFIWSPLPTVCAIGGDFTANITAYFYDATLAQLRAAKTYCRFSGQYLNDVSEVAGIDMTAYLEIIGAQTAQPPSNAVPGSYLFVTNGWTAVPGSQTSGTSLLNGPGIWVHSIVQTVGPSGPEGVLSGN